MKFWYVTVLEKSKTIFSKQCMTVQEANTVFKEKKEAYPSPQYIVMKENY
jgi:hypothetical protein